MTDADAVAPAYPYEPPDVADLDLNVALVGCGGIVRNSHLPAYRDAGIDVVACCDIEAERAREARDEHYPEADVTTDASEVFTRGDVDVVDVATHPGPRVGLIEDAIEAGKHVLSQKPFVLDLDDGERLVELADERGVKLAVNQNGRWSPHWSYARQAVEDGLLGDVTGVHLAVHWDHDWITDTGFDEIDHAVLYDYGIHFFDAVAFLTRGHEAETAFATSARSPAQSARPPLLEQALVGFADAQASVAFDANTPEGRYATTYVAGTEGSIESHGPDIGDQTLTVHREGESASPGLEGTWGEYGFRGTMAELLRSVAEDRDPPHSARDNLRSLELCFAAVASAEDGDPKTPGAVRTLPGSE